MFSGIIEDLGTLVSTVLAPAEGGCGRYVENVVDENVPCRAATGARW